MSAGVGSGRRVHVVLSVLTCRRLKSTGLFAAAGTKQPNREETKQPNREEMLYVHAKQDCRNTPPPCVREFNLDTSNQSIQSPSAQFE